MRRLPALLFLAGCASVHGRATSAEAYARALEQGDLDAAYSLTAPEFRKSVDPAEFRLRFAETDARERRAQRVRGALRSLETVAPELGSAAADSGEAEDPAWVVVRFSEAAEEGRFDAALRWLASPLRARYTPERLRWDWDAEPDAHARLVRARAALARTPERTATDVRYPLDDGAAVRLVHEPDGWRLASLE